MKKLILIFGFIVVAASPARAEILEAEQTALGMDCAPCAYSIELGMKKFKGAKDFEISLNKQTVAIRFKPGNKVKLAEIRKFVEDKGFAAKETKLRVAGTLQRRGNELALAVESGDRLPLKPSAENKEAWEKLQGLGDGEKVIVRGVATAGVTSIELWELSAS
jgi:copper chaperone CopZ